MSRRGIPVTKKTSSTIRTCDGGTIRTTTTTTTTTNPGPAPEAGRPGGSGIPRGGGGGSGIPRGGGGGSGIPCGGGGASGIRPPASAGAPRYAPRTPLVPPGSGRSRVPAPQSIETTSSVSSLIVGADGRQTTVQKQTVVTSSGRTPGQGLRPPSQGSRLAAPCPGARPPGQGLRPPSQGSRLQAPQASGLRAPYAGGMQAPRPSSVPCPGAAPPQPPRESRLQAPCGGAPPVSRVPCPGAAGSSRTPARPPTQTLIKSTSKVRLPDGTHIDSSSVTTERTMAPGPSRRSTPQGQASVTSTSTSVTTVPSAGAMPKVKTVTTTSKTSTAGGKKKTVTQEVTKMRTAPPEGRYAMSLKYAPHTKEARLHQFDSPAGIRRRMDEKPPKGMKMIPPEYKGTQDIKRLTSLGPYKDTISCAMDLTGREGVPSYYQGFDDTSFLERNVTPEYGSPESPGMAAGGPRSPYGSPGMAAGGPRSPYGSPGTAAGGRRSPYDSPGIAAGGPRSPYDSPGIAAGGPRSPYDSPGIAAGGPRSPYDSPGIAAGGPRSPYDSPGIAAGGPRSPYGSPGIAAGGPRSPYDSPGIAAGGPRSPYDSPGIAAGGPRSPLGEDHQRSILEREVEQQLYDAAAHSPGKIITATGSRMSPAKRPVIMTDRGPVQATEQLLTEKTVEKLPGAEKITRRMTAIEAQGCGALQTELDKQVLSPGGLPKRGEVLRETVSVRSSTVIAPGIKESTTTVVYETTKPPDKIGMSPQQVEQLVEQETKDVDKTMKLKPLDLKVVDPKSYGIRKREHGLKLNFSTVLELEKSLMLPEPSPDHEQEEVQPEMMATIMHTEEEGLPLGSIPAQMYNSLFPDQHPATMITVNSAAPAPLQDVLVPGEMPENFHTAAATGEMGAVAGASDYTGEKPSGNVYSETTQGQKPKSKNVARRGNRPKLTDVPLLSKEMPPWGIEDMQPIMELVGAPLNTSLTVEALDETGEGATPPPPAADQSTLPMDMMLQLEPPSHSSRVQLRGSCRPAWFPGYYMALPDNPDIVTVEKTPDNVLSMAWRAVQPNFFPEDSFIIV